MTPGIPEWNCPKGDSNKNWPAPNNSYIGKCVHCNNLYLGPKRSISCFRCKNDKNSFDKQVEDL